MSWFAIRLRNSSATRAPLPYFDACTYTTFIALSSFVRSRQGHRASAAAPAPGPAVPARAGPTARRRTQESQPRYGPSVNQQTLEIDPGSRQRLAERFGHAVEGWFAQLPAVLVTLVDRWRLDLGEQIPHGSVSIIYRCRLADGRPAVLKVSPDRARIAEETAALRAWRTVHVPRVIGSDEAFGALLIEAIEPGIPLDAAPDDASAETVAELVNAVHLGTPGPSLPRVEQRIDARFRSSEAIYRRYPALSVVISKE